MMGGKGDERRQGGRSGHCVRARAWRPRTGLLPPASRGPVTEEGLDVTRGWARTNTSIDGQRFEEGSVEVARMTDEQLLARAGKDPAAFEELLPATR
jgi:hypothetical protein